MTKKKRKIKPCDICGFNSHYQTSKKCWDNWVKRRLFLCFQHRKRKSIVFN